MEEWAIHKNICENSQKFSPFQVGFSAFFLNRTSRSGIIGGGIIGGRNQTGPYKIDARFNKATLSYRITELAKMKRRIKLSMRDACEILESDSIDTGEYIFYFDPPYLVQNQQLYRNYYRYDDHQRLASLIKSLRSPWIVTYNNCMEVAELYSDCEGSQFDISYYAHQKRPGNEVMYFGNVALPMPPYTSKRARENIHGSSLSSKLPDT